MEARWRPQLLLLSVHAYHYTLHGLTKYKRPSCCHALLLVGARYNTMMMTREGLRCTEKEWKSSIKLIINFQPEKYLPNEHPVNFKRKWAREKAPRIFGENLWDRGLLCSWGLRTVVVSCGSGITISSGIERDKQKAEKTTTTDRTALKLEQTAILYVAIPHIQFFCSGMEHPLIQHNSLARHSVDNVHSFLLCYSPACCWRVELDFIPSFSYAITSLPSTWICQETQSYCFRLTSFDNFVKKVAVPLKILPIACKL